MRATFTLGDGGRAVYGGAPWPAAWLTLATAFRDGASEEGDLNSADRLPETLEEAYLRPVRLNRERVMPRRELKIGGYAADELLALPAEAVTELICVDEAFTFTVGSASFLGEFRLLPGRLVAELAHIDGGGEGVLPFFASVCERYCQAHGIPELEWIVHAVACARPHIRMREALERRGFERSDVPGVGLAYHRLVRFDHVTGQGNRLFA